MKKTIEMLAAIIGAVYAIAVAVAFLFGMFVMQATMTEQAFVVKAAAAIAYVAFGWLAMLSVEKFWDFLSRV